MDLLFLDTETTGNDFVNDRLCQICFKTDEEICCEYFKPSVPISVKSMSITHITNKMVADKQPFLDCDLHKKLKKLIKNHVLVAHNARFDVEILKHEGIEVKDFICTLKVARFLDDKDVIPEYNLQFLRYYLDLEVDANAHDATGDVLVLEAVFERLFNKMMEQIGDREAVLKEMIEISSRPTLFTKIPFGKHKDKFLKEVAEQDREYLLWLLNQKILNNPEDEDWIYTLQHHLKLKSKES